jgi:hypothetical protein
MNPHIHALDNLEHAQWKVNFIRHLLQAHLASPWKGTREWQLQHAEFLLRLSTAEDELALCKKAPAILQKIVEGTEGDSGCSELLPAPALECPSAPASPGAGSGV